MLTSFHGRAVLHFGKEEREVQVTSDLEERRLIARHSRTENEDEEHFLRMLTSGTPASADLVDVDIQTPNGPMRAARIGNLLVKQRQPGGYGLQDSLLGRSLNFSASMGVVTFILAPASSIIEFSHRTSDLEQSEIIYAGDLSSVPAQQIELESTCFRIDCDRRHFTIRSTKPLWEREKRIRLAVSLLMGVRVAPLAAFESGVLRINLTKDISYKQSHRLNGEENAAGPLFECLLRFFFGLSGVDFMHWYKSCAFLLEAKAGQTELDIGLVNLFVYLEMWDGSKTLTANTLAPMLEISINEAKLVCRTRNALVHEKRALTDGFQHALAELASWDPNFSADRFGVGDEKIDSGVMFVFWLYERVNKHLCRQIGWQGKYNNYDYVFSQQRPR